MTTITTCLALSLPATPPSIRQARVSVAETAARLGASARVVDDVRLCVSEAVSNVVRHAYGTQRGDVDLVVEQESADLYVVVRDAGHGMRRDAYKKRTAGGYGLRIMDAIAERLTITTAPEAGTEVRMTFSLAGAPAR